MDNGELGVNIIAGGYDESYLIGGEGIIRFHCAAPDRLLQSPPNECCEANPDHSDDARTGRGGIIRPIVRFELCFSVRAALGLEQRPNPFI